MNDDPATNPPPSCHVSPEMGSRNLLRVVPVAQQQQLGNVSVLVYSLELYETGFVAVVRLSWVGEGGGLPNLRWSAQDNHGTPYTHFGCGGSGGSRPPTHFSWRLGCTFGGSIPAGATELVMTATSLGFQTITFDDNQEPHIQRGQSIAGPWRFVIPLRITGATRASHPPASRQ